MKDSLEHTGSETHLLSILKQVFGFSEFRPHQQNIIEAALEKRDVFAALPTGGGKSLCYQLPSVIRDGLTIVVSPLIALMKDQVDAARTSGIRAGCLNSAMESDERQALYRELYRGEIDLLYIAPERLGMEGTFDRLEDWGCNAIAVDEAHCISEWGHEFRPDYRQLKRIRASFPQIPIMALTATATAHVQEDIIHQLGLINPLTVRSGFDRPEIFYRVEPKRDVLLRIKEFVQDRSGVSGIIYRSTRADVEKTALYLSNKGIPCAAYHAGLSDDLRRENQDSFKTDKVPLIAATVAFGMGINKPDIRFVIHGDLPKSLESYYQETGRSGRDGDSAETLLLWDARDLAKIQWHIDKMENVEEQKRAKDSLRKMIRFADTFACRRRMLLAHFNEEHPGDCGKCDVCRGELETVDATEDARKFLSAMVRTHQRYGRHFLIDILRGNATDRIRERSYQNLPTFGVGSDLSKRYWLAIAGDMEAKGYIFQDEEQYRALFISEEGRELLYGRREFFTIRRVKTKKETRYASTVSLPSDGEGLEEKNAGLFEALRVLRFNKAKEMGKPPYLIFPDRTLRAMASLRPKTNEELLSCPGVGEKKLQAWGTLFLKAIEDFESEASAQGQ